VAFSVRMHHYYCLFFGFLLNTNQVTRQEKIKKRWSVTKSLITDFCCLSQSVGPSLVFTSEAFTLTACNSGIPYSHGVSRQCACESLHLQVQYLCALRHHQKACYVYFIKRQNQHHSYTDYSVQRNTMKRQRCTDVLAWTPQGSYWRIRISWGVVTNSQGQSEIQIILWFVLLKR